MRFVWKSHKPKPVVRTSRRSQPVFGQTPSYGHVAIAKRGTCAKQFLLTRHCNYSDKKCCKSQEVLCPRTSLQARETTLEERTDSGTAGVAIEKLDSFDAQFQPILNAVQRAPDNPNPSHFPGSHGTSMAITGVFPPSSEPERAMNYDATKDPRVRDARASS